MTKPLALPTARPGQTYPVGLLTDINRRRVRYGLQHYVWSYCIKGRRWRALRNYFNGYLCEHDGHPHNAGRGWTKRAAERRAARICATTHLSHLAG